MGEGSAEVLLCLAVDAVEAVSRGQRAGVSLLGSTVLVQIFSISPPPPAPALSPCPRTYTPQFQDPSLVGDAPKIQLLKVRQERERLS